MIMTNKSIGKPETQLVPDSELELPRRRLVDFRAAEVCDDQWANEIWLRAARAPISSAKDTWEQELALHPDREKVEWFLHGVEYGFNLKLGVMDEDAEPPELMENNASATARPELIRGWVEVEAGAGLWAHSLSGRWPNVGLSISILWGWWPRQRRRSSGPRMTRREEE